MRLQATILAGLAGPAGATGLLAVYQLAPLPVAAVAVLGFLVCAWRWPTAALSAVVLALPFHRLLRPVAGGWGFSAAEVGIVLCVAGAVLRFLAQQLAVGATRRPNLPPPFPAREGGAVAEPPASGSSGQRSLPGSSSRLASGPADGGFAPALGGVATGGGQAALQTAHGEAAQPPAREDRPPLPCGDERQGVRRALPSSVGKGVEGFGCLAGLRLTFFDVAPVAFVALAILSLTVSIKPWESLRSLRTIVLEPVALYYLVVLLGGGRPGARRLAGAVVASAVAISLVGLYQYVTNQNIITAEESLRRIRGFYGSPNHLGLYLGRAAPLALCLGVFGGAGRWVYALALLPIAAALVLTFSVGAWLGVLAALAFVATLRGRRTLLTVLAGLTALTAVAAPLLAGLQRFRSHLDFDEGTTFQRFQVWQSALAMVRDHPILGVGLDNFLYYYRDLGYMLPAGWREPDLSHPHNLILDFWLSLGLAGLVLCLALLVRFFGVGLAVYRSEREPWARALALGLMASMVDFAAHGLIDNAYFLIDLAVLFWLSFAILRVLQGTGMRRDLEEAPT